MRVTPLLLALSISFPLLADPAPVGALQALPRADVPALRARADALRRAGDYDAALQAYQAELAATGETADLLKHIGWTQKALRRFRAAAEALQRATELDPSDREAQDDLADLKRARGLRLLAWLGGTEPGTSKNAVEGQIRYSGVDRLELQAGASWTDNIFYESSRGYATGYWFTSGDSYLKAGLSYRQYGYTGANRPTPDSNAYRGVPLADLEVSHWFERSLRVGVDYQVFAPDFFYDQAKRIVNQKVSAEAEVPLGRGLSATAFAALLRDPDPGLTLIAGRPVPGAPAGTTCPGGGPGVCADATSVVFRTQFLAGGGLAYESERFGASVKFIPNRDLDAGFSWSLLSGADLRPTDKLSVNLQWILDQYSSSSGAVFAGNFGNIYWGTVRYQLIPELAASLGLKWVANPGPASTTGAGTRNDGTLLANLEYRTSLF